MFKCWFRRGWLGKNKNAKNTWISRKNAKMTFLSLFSISMNQSTLLKRSSNPVLLKDKCVNRGVWRMAKHLTTQEKELQIQGLVVQDLELVDCRFGFKRCNSAWHRNLTLLWNIQIHISDKLSYMKTCIPDHRSFFFLILDFKMELCPL